MRTRSLVIAITLLALVASPALARDAFVGTWKVVVTPGEDVKEKEYKDTFVFKGMQFESAESKKKGFKAAAYEEDTRGGVVATFKCKVKNAAGDEAEWTGTSTGVDLTGELTVTKKDGTEVKYTFKGQKNQ